MRRTVFVGVVVTKTVERYEHNIMLALLGEQAWRVIHVHDGREVLRGRRPDRAHRQRQKELKHNRTANHGTSLGQVFEWQISVDIRVVDDKDLQHQRRLHQRIHSVHAGHLGHSRFDGGT